MKYLFGPVNSRRLGLSQGIDLIPDGVCSFNCIYCEVGRPKQLTSRRFEYSPVKEIIAELETLFQNRELADSIDVFTITASGEPTLHSGIKDVITAVKKRSGKPVTVLTNGSTLYLSKVRRDLSTADIVVPSLDAVLLSPFRKVNRPANDVDLEAIIKGIAKFKQEFSGQLWLEILLVTGINDRPEDIAALRKAIKFIGPDKIQLNTVARPPIESFAKPLTEAELRAAAAKLGDKVEIIASFSGTDKKIAVDVKRCDIIELLRRRPGTVRDISQALSANKNVITSHLQHLQDEGVIITTRHSNKEYWLLKE